MATEAKDKNCSKDSNVLVLDKDLGLHLAQNAEDVVVKIEKEEDGPFGGMSLDVLAQVASDRLEIDEHRSAKKKTPKRAVQNMDRLDLEQIQNLSDKLLVSLFSDMTCDEIKKMYTLKCFLMPRSCQHQITVYGNEMKARLSMKNHLRTHVEFLEKVKLEEGCSEVFSSEPVPARKKRLAAQYAREQKMKKGKKVAVSLMKKGQYPSPRLKRGRPPSFPQSLQDYAELGMDVGSDGTDSACNKDRNQKRLRKNSLLKIREEDSHPLVVKSGNCEEKDIHSSDVDARLTARQEGEKQAQEIRQQLASGSLENIHPGVSSELLSGDIDKEQLIIDLMQKEQPFRDHNYTSILGRKPNFESMQCEISNSEENIDIETSRVSARRLGPEPSLESRIFSKALLEAAAANTYIRMNEEVVPSSTLSVPILRLPGEAVMTPGSSTPEEIVLQELTRLAEKMTQKSQLIGGADESETNADGALVPLVDGEKHAKLAADEAQMTSDDGDEDLAATVDAITADANPHRRGRKGLENSSGEWERKAALKCIRELRIRKKDDSTLVCKICKDKTFTATATLLYHYRSHAGIKPFVCLICNTTFTRQHSLNYHMLIHNNQSRFTCKECGRKFRHPSHFKEHMRRHTGETPYHCTDCPLRFKTRNTYKRHLRTRHDKLLTSCGIQKMSVEEVALNKAMQQYAMEQQHNYHPPDHPADRDQSAENAESDHPSFKAIAPKRETSKTAQTNTATSALAQALLAPITTRPSVVTAPRTSAVTSHVTTEALLSTSNSSHGTGAHAVSSAASMSFLQQAPLTCFTPLNSAQQLVLGQPAQLQQFVMALPQQNTFLATPSQTVSMATLSSGVVTLSSDVATLPSGVATLASAPSSVGGMTQSPLLMTPGDQTVMATHQPLVALATGQGPGQQNVLMTAPLSQQPILTPLQPLQPLQATNVVTSDASNTLTLTPQTAQFMGVTLNQPGFIQPFQTLQGTLQVNTTQAPTLQVNALTPMLQHNNPHTTQASQLQLASAQLSTMQLGQGQGHSFHVIPGQSNAAAAALQWITSATGQATTPISTFHHTPTTQSASGVTLAPADRLCAQSQEHPAVAPIAEECPSSEGQLIRQTQSTVTCVPPQLSAADLVALSGSTAEYMSAGLPPDYMSASSALTAGCPQQQQQQQQPDTPAARTLLKFCSQVANQMGQVIPSNMT